MDAGLASAAPCPTVINAAVKVIFLRHSSRAPQRTLAVLLYLLQQIVHTPLRPCGVLLPFVCQYNGWFDGNIQSSIFQFVFFALLYGGRVGEPRVFNVLCTSSLMEQHPSPWSAFEKFTSLSYFSSFISDFSALISILEREYFSTDSLFTYIIFQGY